LLQLRGFIYRKIILIQSTLKPVKKVSIQIILIKKTAKSLKSFVRLRKIMYFCTKIKDSVNTIYENKT